MKMQFPMMSDYQYFSMMWWWSIVGLFDFAFCGPRLSLFYFFISKHCRQSMGLSCMDVLNLVVFGAALLSSGLDYPHYIVFNG